MMANGKVQNGSVDEWMDCGNKNVTVETNSRMLGFASRWSCNGKQNFKI
jgi:glucose-1-phosphate thymidylyltransferase